MREKLKATRGFTYAGKALVAGSSFSASRQDARVLRAVGRAVTVVQDEYIAPVAPVEVVKSEAVEEVEATPVQRAKPGRKPKADRAE